MKPTILFLSGIGMVWLALASPSPAQPAAPAGKVDYARLGIPDPERVWKLSEYKGVFNALRSLPPDDLPRRAASSGVYERMSSLDNLKALHNTSVPLRERMQEASAGKILLPLTGLYMSQVYKDKVLQDEAIGMLNFMVQLTCDLFVVMDEFEASQPVERRANPDNLKGKEAQVSGWEEQILGMMMMAGERQTWESAHRIEILRIIQRSVAETRPRLTPRFTKEADAMISRHLSEESDTGVKEALVTLQKSLPKA